MPNYTLFCVMFIFYEPAAGFQVLSIEPLWKQILTTIAL